MIFCGFQTSNPWFVPGSSIRIIQLVSGKGLLTATVVLDTRLLDSHTSLLKACSAYARNCKECENGKKELYRYLV